MTDCATRGCFTPAVPRSAYCSAHALQIQRVRSYMAEGEIAIDSASKPAVTTTTDARHHILSTLREWLTRARR